MRCAFLEIRYWNVYFHESVWLVICSIGVPDNNNDNTAGYAVNSAFDAFFLLAAM